MIEMHARFAPGFTLHDDRADAVAEVVALCWMWFCRLANRGKDATTFSTTLASFAPEVNVRSLNVKRTRKTSYRRRLENVAVQGYAAN